MTRLGNQLIMLVDLESHQNENGVISGFLSRECVCIMYLAYALFVSQGQIRLKLSFGLWAFDLFS